MYKQLTKLTMSQLPAGALPMTFVIYNQGPYYVNVKSDIW